MCKIYSVGVYIQFRPSFVKEFYFYDEQLKSYENKYWKSSMRERIPLAWPWMASLLSSLISPAFVRSGYCSVVPKYG